MIKQVRANYDAPVIEKEIQEFWKTEKAYEKTKESKSKGKGSILWTGRHTPPARSIWEQR